MYQVFIDGKEGTTGLQIVERLRAREDIEILEIESNKRKIESEKRKLIEKADVVILCLPDKASQQVVNENAEIPGTKFIDASTAFRIHPDWTYGLPELSKKQRELVGESQRVSNPGCYATGFVIPIKPLIDQGVLNPSSELTISAISGYSGGGRSLIERYEKKSFNSSARLWPARQYSLSLNHKHLPEMRRYTGLKSNPVFLPVVANFYQGMTVNISIPKGMFSKKISIQDIQGIMKEVYDEQENIKIYDVNDEKQLDEGFLDPERASNSDLLEIFTFGHDDQVLLTSRLDNLGKGAAGAALQNLNLMLGLPEYKGLKI
ncbi:MAG: N-acetyl-gamma-glutamyl-phosphate reductase [Gammaproteobacteria bacterium]|nr:N-acetyl-gamma-glutamyl-phosphate reductase [Gammaproteobacteria bacterium]